MRWVNCVLYCEHTRRWNIFLYKKNNRKKISNIFHFLILGYLFRIFGEFQINKRQKHIIFLCSPGSVDIANLFALYKWLLPLWDITSSFNKSFLRDIKLPGYIVSEEQQFFSTQSHNNVVKESGRIKRLFLYLSKAYVTALYYQASPLCPSYKGGKARLKWNMDPNGSCIQMECNEKLGVWSDDIIRENRNHGNEM